MSNIKISLNSNKGKKNVNKDITIPLNLHTDNKIYPENVINGVVNAYDKYENERESCNKVRLICEINPICTNALFNPVTEIVKNEGSENVILLNYKEMTNKEISMVSDANYPIKPITRNNKPEDSTYENSDNDNFIWDNHQAIRDTQLNNETFGFKYNCGVDIFNNHLLRSNTFKIISYNKENSYKGQSNGVRQAIVTTGNTHVYIDENFNTIDDWMRDSMGNRILNNFFNPTVNGNFIGFSFKESDLRGDKKDEKYAAVFNVDFNFAVDRTVFGDLSKNEIKIYFDYVVLNNDEKSFNYSFSGTQLDISEFGSDGKSFRVVAKSGYDSSKNFDESSKAKVQLYPDSINIMINSYNDSSFIDEGGTIYTLIYRPTDKLAGDTWLTASHMYQNYDIESFSLTVKHKLKEYNGWFGFKNISRLPTYDASTKKRIDISKPINNEITGSFIDMYPTRDLFSFSPKYNKFRKRVEKNWDYAITYPSSSTTKGIDFIDDKTNGLKILFFDEFTKNDDGQSLITIYSISQHGLKIGDTVNIYSNNDDGINLIIGEATVENVYNKYIFQIYKGNTYISNKWYDASEKPKEFSADGKTYIADGNFYRSNGKIYYMSPDSNRVNLDDNFLNLSFKKVVNNVECSYYVRVFSKLPNFKFSDKEVNDENLYGKDSAMIKEYSDSGHTFDSHINKLSFAKNIYGDEETEIVFTDDIDLSHLKDNLGRPLTDIYLTINKSNKGYKKWYGVDGTDIDLNSDEIEFSHCFGKNTCGFRLSDESIDENNLPDIRIIGYLREGLSMKTINNESKNDEIEFDKIRNFYGDLCCYSPYSLNEESIQPVMNRFNTAQRELKSTDKSYKYFKNFYEDEINVDETMTGFKDPFKSHLDGLHSEKVTVGCLPRMEGYYYQSHYKIPIKTLSSKVKQMQAIKYDVLDINKVENFENCYDLLTSQDLSFTMNDKALLYDISNNEIYHCIISNFYGGKKVRCYLYDNKNNEKSISEIGDICNYKLVKRDENIPYYADFLPDGTFNFYWREVLQNGFDDNSVNEVYPFANNALYVNRKINFYLRRQDPYNETDISTDTNELTKNGIAYEPYGEEVDINKTDNGYITEENLTEC